MSTSSLRWNLTRCPGSITWAPWRPPTPVCTRESRRGGRAWGSAAVRGTFWEASRRPPSAEAGAASGLVFKASTAPPKSRPAPAGPRRRHSAPTYSLTGGEVGEGEKSFEALSFLPLGWLKWFNFVCVKHQIPMPKNWGMMFSGGGLNKGRRLGLQLPRLRPWRRRRKARASLPGVSAPQEETPKVMPRAGAVGADLCVF